MKRLKHILTQKWGIQNSKNKYTEEKYTNNNNLQISFVNNKRRGKGNVNIEIAQITNTKNK